MSNKYSEKEVERLLALRAKATPGPYCVTTDNAVCADHPTYENSVMDLREFDSREGNAEFLASIHSLADQLAAAREIVNRQARFILHEVKWDAWGGDWACAQCHPNSDMLAQGFVCCYHEALRLTEEST